LPVLTQRRTALFEVQERNQSTQVNPPQKKKLKDGPSLQDFLSKYTEQSEETIVTHNRVPYLETEEFPQPKGKGRPLRCKLSESL